MMKIRRFEQSAIEASIMFDDDKGEYRGIDFDLRKSTIRLYAQMDKSAFTRWFPIADLIAFAKAGGKLSEGDKAVSAYIARLITERDTLKAELVVCERDMASMDRTITARTAEVAKLTKGKVVVAKRDIRCIDCGHLDLGTLQNGHAECGDTGTHIMIDVYRLGYCHHFTPAAEGCGSVDQALQAELARVTEEGGK